MKVCYIIIGIVLAFLSCQEPKTETDIKSKDQSKGSLIVGDMDTAKIISRLAIKETASRLNLVNEKIKGLSEKTDTLELTYYFSFCDCQRWIVSTIHKKALKERPDLNELDSRGQVEFNLDKQGYYIEAADKELEIDWRATVNGTNIRFIGREYKNKGLPKDGKFTVPDPPEGKVFRYYSYQILRPYQVWGPNKFIEVDKETGDSIKQTTQLTVR